MKLWHERAPETLAGIDNGVDQYGARENRKLAEGVPRVVRAAKENHRREHEAEHQADMLRADARAEREADGGREQRHEEREPDEERDVVAAQRDALAHDEPRRRDDDESGEQRLHHSGDDFLDREPLDLERRKQPIFDLLGELEL